MSANPYVKLAMTVSQTSKARNGYMHKPKKKKEPLRFIVTMHRGQIVNKTPVLSDIPIKEEEPKPDKPKVRKWDGLQTSDVRYFDV